MKKKCKSKKKVFSDTNRKVVIAFILGILISGTSVYAATKYKASDIIYKDTTVNNALNNLYDNSISLDEENIFYNYFKYGYISTSKESLSLDLKKGRYICSVSAAVAWSDASSMSTHEDDDKLISNIKGCSNIKFLKSSAILQTSNAKISGNYLVVNHTNGNFICDVDSNTQISYEFSGNVSSNEVPVSSILSCNKIK